MPGLPRATYMPFPFQIVQTPHALLLAYEFASTTRVVRTDRPGLGSGIGDWGPYSKTKRTTVSLFFRRWRMGKSYRHLDYTERALIYWWRKEQLSLRAIARRLQRSHASISRELKRHLWCGLHYYPRGAQILYTYRLERRVQRDRLKSQSVRESVHQKLHLGWTPELIAGRLKFHSHLPSVCHESIYQYIYGVAPDLIASSV